MRMTRLFRSKSCSLPGITTPDSSNSAAAGLAGEPHESTLSPAKYQFDTEEEDEDTMEEEEDDDDDDDEEEEEGDTEYLRLRRKKNNSNSNESSPVMTSFNFIGGVVDKGRRRRRRRQNNVVMSNPAHHPLVAIVLTALRKSLLVTCSVERDEDVSNHLDIGWPTDVRHVSHVTFDPFNGFLGLPLELQYDLPRKVPSASASVFGVSAQSMQCSHDNRGNCIPTILLMMQNRLYSEGGLQAEGIFRINAENSQEENVRNQLNRGVLPHGIDIHCLAGLIKAWFRELPTGVLDSLTPEQVMHCNAEEECTQLVDLLPLTEAALLDWAINLMADIVLHEHYNKMNARNIAMVFAPNMTQMADPLTALIHAVQVMNFLKMLINKTLRERELDSRTCLLSPTTHSPNDKEIHSPDLGVTMQCKQALDGHCTEGSHASKLAGDGSTMARLEPDAGEKWRFGVERDGPPDGILPVPILCKSQTLESSLRDRFGNEGVDEAGILEKLSLREGVRKLCRHPVFQLSKAVKKKTDTGMVNSRGGGGEAWT